MTLAVANPTPASPTAPHAVPIVILGTDAVLAALPATAVQLVHACMEAGFASVIPASWGDELIAAATLRRLPEFGDGPVIQCSCPIVAHRLLSVSGDLRPVILPLVPPPVALARYVRARSQPRRARVTYVGACPGAIDDSIDIRMTPEALLSLLAERQINLEDQPQVFESFIPADRRRFRSQPGGLPTAEALWSERGSRTLVEVDSDDFAAEVAQHVLAGRKVLIDAALKLGCACSGAVSGVLPNEARAFLASLEPPRALAAVVDEQTPIELDQRIPAVPRTPVDVMAVPSAPAPTYAVGARAATPSASTAQVLTPPHATTAVPDSQQTARYTPASRPTTRSAPVIRAPDGKEGRTLPRAYVARRRLTPRSMPAVPADPRLTQTPAPTEIIEPIELVEFTYSTELIEIEDAPALLEESSEATETVDLGLEAAALPLESTVTDVGPMSGVGEDLHTSTSGVRDARSESTAPFENSDSGNEARRADAPSSIEAQTSHESETLTAPTENAATESLSEPDLFADPAETHDAELSEAAEESVVAADLTIPDAAASVEAENSTIVLATPAESETAQIHEASPPAPVAEPLERTTPTTLVRPSSEPAMRVVEQPSERAAAAAAAAPAPASFNGRHIVFFLLAVVVVAVVVSATVALYFERRFAPPVVAPSSSDR